MLPDIPAIYPLWRNLVDTHSVLGRQVHEARIVAVMLAHEVTHILTLNPADFRRYGGVIKVIEPKDMAKAEKRER